MNQAVVKNDLLTGSINRAIVKLSLPVMATTLFHTFYSLADAFWLGRLGREALAAPGVSAPVIFLLISMGMGFSAAGTTLVAQYIGSGNRTRASLAAGQTFIFIIPGALGILLIGQLAAVPLLQGLQTPKDVFSNALVYLRIIFAGVPFMGISFVYFSVMRGFGDTFTPMLITSLANVLNMVLDPLLIFGWGSIPALGVRGAALATVVCQALASMTCIYLLSSGKRGLRIVLTDLKPERKLFGKIASIGGPMAIGQSGSSLGFMLIQGIVNSFGSVVISAFSVAHRLIHLINVPGMGISSACTALVGQNLGADQIQRAEKTIWNGIAMVTGIMAVGCSILFFRSEFLMRLFIDDPEVVVQGTILFRIVSYTVLFFGVIMVVFSAFQGAGKTAPVMILSLGRLWGLRIPAAYVLSFVLGMGSKGIWWAMFISNLLTSIAGMFWFSRGTWKRKVI